MLRACEQVGDGDGERPRKKEKEEKAEEKKEDKTQSPHTQRRKAGMLAVLPLCCAHNADTASACALECCLQRLAEIKEPPGGSAKEEEEDSDELSLVPVSWHNQHLWRRFADALRAEHLAGGRCSAARRHVLRRR